MDGWNERVYLTEKSLSYVKQRPRRIHSNFNYELLISNAETESYCIIRLTTRLSLCLQFRRPPFPFKDVYINAVAPFSLILIKFTKCERRKAKTVNKL